MRVFLLCNSSSSSLSLSPPPTTHHRPQKPLVIPPPKPSLITSLTGAALSFNLLFLSPLTPLPPPSIASDFTPSIFQSECREEDQRREEERRLESAPELVTNEEIVKEAWEIVNDSFLGSDRNRWSPQSWLVCISSSLLFYRVSFSLLVYSLAVESCLPILGFETKRITYFQ